MESASAQNEEIKAGYEKETPDLLNEKNNMITQTEPLIKTEENIGNIKIRLQDAKTQNIVTEIKQGSLDDTQPLINDNTSSATHYERIGEDEIPVNIVINIKTTSNEQENESKEADPSENDNKNHETMEGVIEDGKRPIVDEDPSLTCPKCTFINKVTSIYCEICTTPLLVDKEKWACPQCTFIQPNTATHCEMCNRAHDQHINPPEEPPRGLSLMRSISDSLKSAGLLATSPVKLDFYCDICMNNVSVSKKANLCCPHEFCKPCMEEFVIVEINEARVLNVTCPGINDKTNKSCTAPFSKKDIQEIVDEKVWEKYERFVKLKTNNAYVDCPFCNQLQKGSKFKPRMKCERAECAKEFCYIHSNAHAGISCAEYEKKKRQEFKEARVFINKTSVKCPVIYCGVEITKFDGCNHMTCSQCKTEFCYLCGDDYMGGFHFSGNNCLGCPDMQMRDNLQPNSRRNCKDFPRLVCARLMCPLMCLMMFVAFIWGESCFIMMWVICFPCAIIFALWQLIDDSDEFCDNVVFPLCSGCIAPFWGCYVLATNKEDLNPRFLCRRDVIYPCLCIFLVLSLGIAGYFVLPLLPVNIW